MFTVKKILTLIILTVILNGCDEVKLTEEQKKEMALRHSRSYRERCIVYYLDEINKKLDIIVKKGE